MSLEKWEDNLANNMSSSHQQLVAIGLAFAMNPALILADEPAGNRDTVSTGTVFEMMRKVNIKVKTTFLIVTHNLDLVKRCDRIIDVVDGWIVNSSKIKKL